MLICFIVFDYMVLENSVLHFHFVGFGVVCVCTLVLSLNEVYREGSPWLAKLPLAPFFLGFPCFIGNEIKHIIIIIINRDYRRPHSHSFRPTLHYRGSDRRLIYLKRKIQGELHPHCRQYNEQRKIKAAHPLYFTADGTSLFDLSASSNSMQN